MLWQDGIVSFFCLFLSDMRFPLRMINGLQNNLSRRRKFFYEKNVFKTQLLLHENMVRGIIFLLHTKWTFSINFWIFCSNITSFISYSLMDFVGICLFTTFLFLPRKNKTNKRKLKLERTFKHKVMPHLNGKEYSHTKNLSWGAQ